MLETDKKLLVTSNNLFRLYYKVKRGEESFQLRLFKPLKSTHCKISSFAISYHVHSKKKLFVTKRKTFCRFCHWRHFPSKLEHRRETQKFWTFHDSPVDSFTFHVTSSNLHFGLMCTFICILENLNFFFLAPFSQTHQHFSVWKRWELSPFIIRCRLKIKINSFFDVCWWRLKLYHFTLFVFLGIN